MTDQTFPADPVRISDMAYARFAAPDLARMAAFGRDFGFRDIRHTPDGLLSFASLRSFPAHITAEGPAGFAGFGAFMSLDGLRQLASRHGAGLERLGEPYHAHRVRLRDPDGCIVDLLCPDSLQVRPPAPRPGWNEGGAPGRENVRLTLSRGPSRVRRLGHIVLAVSDIAASRRWYESNLGLRPSDLIMGSDGVTEAGVFMRCSMGARPVDHHSVFLLARASPGFLHAAYEVEDVNDLMTGHDHLKRSGARLHWGVGRHILGNHIFDYWLDPFGHELEHWTDGDVLDETHPPGRHTLETLLGVQWGARHPLHGGQV
jgi:catechol 2,3-dioxygenase-like lactoylglutathione lyase family enzyme